METNNYMHTIPDSQFYPEIDMIINSLKYIQHHMSDTANKVTINDEGIVVIESQSPKAKLDYIIKGLENTKKEGYKIIKVNE